VDTTQLTVTLEHGVLEVRLPKRLHPMEQTVDVHEEAGAPDETGEAVGDASWRPLFKEPMYAA
jgi:hypothetical protein